MTVLDQNKRDRRLILQTETGACPFFFSVGVLDPPASRRDRHDPTGITPRSGDGGGSGGDSDGSGGGGNGGDDDPGRGLPISSGMLMMGFFLCAVTMLFAAFIMATIFYRATAPSWPPPGIPPLPRTLAANTLIILSSSATLAVAAAMRRKSRRQLRLWLGLTAGLGLLFIALQLQVWLGLIHQGMTPDKHDYNYGAIFYMITGLHGLHVLGGIVALLTIFFMALRRQPGPTEGAALGVCSLYWHFVGGLWLVLYAVIQGMF